MLKLSPSQSFRSTKPFWSLFFAAKCNFLKVFLKILFFLLSLQFVTRFLHKLNHPGLWMLSGIYHASVHDMVWNTNTIFLSSCLERKWHWCPFYILPECQDFCRKWRLPSDISFPDSILIHCLQTVVWKNKYGKWPVSDRCSPWSVQPAKFNWFPLYHVFWSPISFCLSCGCRKEFPFIMYTSSSLFCESLLSHSADM